MAGSASIIPRLLEKFGHYDKDERYMAVLDVCNELMKESFSLDAALEARTCGALLDRLERDSSPDVQAVCVKTLSTLLRRSSSSEQVQVAAKRLSVQVVSGPESLRDVIAMGLKTVISSVNLNCAPGLVGASLPLLLEACSSSRLEPAVVCEALDVMADLIRTCGGSGCEPYFASTSTVAVTGLTSTHALTRKRCTALIGALAPWLSEAQLEVLVTSLLNLNCSDVTRIATVQVLSRNVGHRLGRQLPLILPMLLQVVTLKDDLNCDLAENGLQALESCVLRSPVEVGTYLPSILQVALACVRFDPNLAYAGECDELELEGVEEGGDDDAEFVDEDDASWKVRRAAVRVVNAVIATVKVQVHDLYSVVSEPLIQALGEREETVRLEVIAALRLLVRASGGTVQVDDSAAALKSTSTAASLPPHVGGLSRQSSASGDLVTLLPRLLKRVFKSCASTDARSVPTRTAMLGLVRDVIASLASSGSAVGNLNPYTTDLIRILLSNACELKSHSHAGGVRLEAITALRHLLLAFSSSPTDIAVQVGGGAIAPLCAAVGDEWYKLTAEALRTTGVLLTLLRPADDSVDRVTLAAPSVSPSTLVQAVTALLTAIAPRLEAHDIDQEIKESALQASAMLLAHCGDVPVVHAAAGKILGIYQDRLRSETTRIAALRAIAYVARSPLTPFASLRTVLESITTDAAALLRQASRPLRQQALVTLTAIMAAQAGEVTPLVLRVICENVALLVEDDDLQLTAQAMRIASAVIAADATPATAGALADTVLPKAVALAASPVLQGAALSACQAFFQDAQLAFASSVPKSFSYNALQDALLNSAAAIAATTSLARSSATGGGAAAAASAASSGAHMAGTSLSAARQSTSSLSRVLAVLVVASPEPTSNVKRFLTSACALTKDMGQYLALLTVAEIGRRVDVTSVAADAPTALLNVLFSPSAPEEVKSAAAIALGGVIVGNVPTTLPLLLSRIEAACSGGGSNAEHAYLLLTALREVIIRHAPAAVDGAPFKHVPAVLPLIMLPGAAGAADEGVRNIAAECLGRCAAVAPDAVLPLMLASVAPTSAPAARWTAVTALRFAVTSADDTSRAACARTLVAGMSDPDLKVQHATMTSVNSLAHTAPAALRDALKHVPAGRIPISDKGAATLIPFNAAEDGILLALYMACIPRPDLVREVDLGPFKHKEDDGLPLRKAAFAALDSIISSPFLVDRMGPELLAPLVTGLRDTDDVKAIVLPLLLKLAGMPAWHATIVADLGAVCDAITEVLNTYETKPVATSVDVVRAALRAVDAVRAGCSDASGVKKFTDLLERVTRKGPFAAVFESVRNDSLR